MSVHWPSFLLGMVSLPLAAVLLGVAASWLGRLGRRYDGRRLEGPRAAPGALEPLNFTPRLIGQIRRPAPEVEESARAS